MFYSSEEIGGRLPLRTLPRLLANEAVNYIDLVPTRTSKRLNKTIIALEDAYNYMERNAKSFTKFVQEVADINAIDYDNIVFSIQPASVYLNDNMRTMMSNLQEQGVPVYINYNTNTKEYKMIDLICNECIRMQSLEPLQILHEFLGNWGNSDTYTSGGARGAMSAGLSMLGDFAQGMFGDTVEQFRTSAVDNATKWLDDKVFGRFGLDGTETQKVLDPKKGVVDKQVTVKNANLKDKLSNSSFFNMDFFKNNPNIKKNVVNFASGVVSDVRKGLSTGVVNKLQHFLGIDPNKEINIPSVINALTQKIADVRRNPNSGFMNNILNQLIALKNHIVSIFNGRK